MNPPTTPHRPLTPEPAHPAPSFRAISPRAPSLAPLRNCYLSIPSTQRAEEMEEKENVNKIPKIDQFLDLERCYFHHFSPIASVRNLINGDDDAHAFVYNSMNSAEHTSLRVNCVPPTKSLRFRSSISGWLAS